MALIDPEALTGTKLGLRRTAEAAGHRNGILNGVDIVSIMYAAETESGTRFKEITEKDGLIPPSGMPDSRWGFPSGPISDSMW